jgi:hypothetical protein
MGANSKQGWCLFAFLAGFTFLVAGLAYLGFVFIIGGLILLIAALAGFYQIKPLEDASSVESRNAPTSTEPPAKQKRAL